MEKQNKYSYCGVRKVVFERFKKRRVFRGKDRLAGERQIRMIVKAN